MSLNNSEERNERDWLFILGLKKSSRLDFYTFMENSKAHAWMHAIYVQKYIK